MVNIGIPLPETLIQATWFLIGFFAGRAGATCDHNIKESDWFKKRSKPVQQFVSGLLDFTHHFWIGMLLMVYAFNPIQAEMYWFGTGLFVDDFPDIPARFANWFKYLATKLSRNGK